MAPRSSKASLSRQFKTIGQTAVSAITRPKRACRQPKLVDRDEHSTEEPSVYGSLYRLEVVTPKQKRAPAQVSTHVAHKEPATQSKRYLDALYNSSPSIEPYIEELRQNEFRRPILHLAAARGDVPMIRYLLDTQNVDRDAKDGQGMSALEYAASKLTVQGYLEVASAFILGVHN